MHYKAKAVSIFHANEVGKLSTDLAFGRPYEVKKFACGLMLVSICLVKQVRDMILWQVALHMDHSLSCDWGR